MAFLLWLLWREGLTLLPRLAWPMILLFYASCHSWVAEVCHHALFYSVEVDSCETFCLLLALNRNPPNLSFPSS
jgi:hypothetical protein